MVCAFVVYNRRSLK